MDAGDWTFCAAASGPVDFAAQARVGVVGAHPGGRPGRLGSVMGMMPRDVVLIGVPTNSSGTVDGVARAPAVLRQGGLSAALAGRPGFTDAGDLALPAPQSRRGPSGLLAEEALITMIGRVAAAVRAARGRGRFPVVLGGD